MIISGIKITCILSPLAWPKINATFIVLVFVSTCNAGECYKKVYYYSLAFTSPFNTNGENAGYAFEVTVTSL